MEGKAVILIVDDTRIVRLALSSLLRQAGYQAESAADAEEALVKLAYGEYAVVLLDLVMPGMNGIELTRIIRQKYPRTEVVLMSGHLDCNQISLRTVFADAGRMPEILPKPFEPEKLIAAVSHALLRREAID